jgi:hypothetical protein
LSKPSRRATRAADRSTGRSGGSYAGDLSSPRAGRRERPRSYYRRSFFDRYRNWIFGIGAVAAVAVLFAFFFLGATGKAYSCSQVWQPDPTASPSSGTTPQLGYLQTDMGKNHLITIQDQRYTLCPPASGTHYNIAGKGPIQPRVYGPDDAIEPQSWLHNLEHGALVVLYRCVGDACQDAGQDRLKALAQRVPNSPICNLPPGGAYGPGPIMVRFDDMAWPYAAIVWDRVLPLETLDADLILQFYQQWGDKTNPERPSNCASPSASPGASGSVAPSGSATPSGSVAPSGSSAASSAAPEASPSPS